MFRFHKETHQEIARRHIFAAMLEMSGSGQECLAVFQTVVTEAIKDCVVLDSEVTEALRTEETDDGRGSSKKPLTLRQKWFGRSIAPDSKDDNDDRHPV